MLHSMPTAYYAVLKAWHPHWLLLQVKPNALLAVSPDRQHVGAESVAELEVSLLPQQPGQFSAVLELEVRGGKSLKLPIRWG